MLNLRTATAAVTIAAALTVLAGCGSSGTKLGSPTTSTPAATTAPTTTPATPLKITINYHPKIDATNFTSRVTNSYFPLTPGKTLHYKGIRDGKPTEHTFVVTHDTKVVMGVKCSVILDTVTQNQSLVEKTTDWYAQDKAGAVWYFGENTAEYQNGVVTSTAGTWEAGVDNAQPGIIIPVHPKVGDAFRQEYRPGVALDEATILSMTATVRVPAGTYRDVLVTFDKNPLDPSKREKKYYAQGVGFVRAVLKGGGHSETTELAK